MKKEYILVAVIMLLLIVVLAFIFTEKMFKKDYLNESNENRNYCSDESRKGLFCAQVYQPVCGWFNSQIKCIRYPCAEIYSNSCVACHDGKVDYWIERECK